MKIHERGVMGMYFLQGGSIFFTESGALTDQWLTLKPEETLIVQMAPADGVHVQMNMTRANEWVGKPSEIVVPRTAILAMSRLTDDVLLQQFRAALAGLVLPGRGNFKAN